MARPKEIDWEAVKSAYVEGKNLSLQKVAKKFKISYASVRRISRMESWVADKNKRWKEAGEDALDKIQDSMSELIIRHAKVGRFLQTIGVKRLERKYKLLLATEEGAKRPRGLRDFDDKTLAYMVKTGAGIERAAFPKQLDVRADVRFSSKGLSKAEDKALYEVFRKNVIKRKPARKRSRGKA